MKITRFNHAALNVAAGMDRMRDFYTGFLGIPEVPRDIPAAFAAMAPGFWMQLGNAQVHVIQAELQGRPHEPAGRHLAFYVENLDAAIAALDGAGVDYERLAGFLFFCDPAGNTVELQQDPQTLPRGD